MHEMSLVRDVVEVVVGAAERQGAARVKTVNLTIGYGRDVVPELLDDLFRHLSRGTVAQDAQLVVDNPPYMVRCKECGTTYHLDTLDRRTWDCPLCGRRAYTVVSGMEFRIDSICVA